MNKCSMVLDSISSWLKPPTLLYPCCPVRFGTYFEPNLKSRLPLSADNQNINMCTHYVIHADIGETNMTINII